MPTRSGRPRSISSAVLRASVAIWFAMAGGIAEIARNGVANAASPGAGIAPDSRFVIRGVGLSGPVRIGGREVPVISQSNNLIEAWVPLGQAAGVYTLEVGNARRSITIARAATGIFAPEQTVRRGQTLGIRVTGTMPRSLSIGGVDVPVARSVSRERGIRELFVNVPPSVPEGCAVPVYAPDSNHVQIAIGSPCPPPDFLPASQDALNGVIVLVRNQAGRVFDEAWGVFARAFKQALPIPPAGLCNAFLRDIDTTLWKFEGFSAGPYLQAASGQERKRIPPLRGSVGVYHAILGGDDGVRRPTPLFFGNGPVLVESQGSEAVRPFRAIVKPPQEGPRFVLPESGSRRAGVEIVWGRAQGTVVLALTTSDASTGIQGACLCVVRAPAERFRIPAAVLAELPASDSGEMFATRLDTSLWSRIDGSGPGALHTAGVTLHSGRIRLE